MRHRPGDAADGTPSLRHGNAPPRMRGAARGIRSAIPTRVALAAVLLLAFAALAAANVAAFSQHRGSPRRRSLTDPWHRQGSGAYAIDSAHLAMRPSPRVVYYCGYDSEREIASLVFPTARAVAWPAGASSVARVNETVMFAFFPRPRCTSYPGRVLVLNGESNDHLATMFPGAPVLGAGATGEGVYAQWALAGFQGLDLASALLRLRDNYGGDVYNDKFLVYTHSHCVRYRDRAFLTLSRIGVVTATGACTGLTRFGLRSDIFFPGTSFPLLDPLRALLPRNPNVVVARQRQRQHWGRNVDPRPGTYSPYRFTLCMENRMQPGYITEKILQAFLGGSVPIYYGTREVLDMFNPARFIFYDVQDPEPALRRIAELEADRAKYLELKRQPILQPGAEERFFSWDSSSHGGKMGRRVKALLGVA